MTNLTKNILKISFFFVIIITASCISAYASTSQYLDDSYYSGKGLAYGDGLLAPTVGSSDDNVDMSRGEVMFSETDYTINGRGDLKIPIVRSYNTNLSIGMVDEHEYSTRRYSPHMVGYYYTCSMDNKDVLIGFEDEFKAYAVGTSFLGRDYSDVKKASGCDKYYYTSSSLKRDDGDYTYNLNKSKGYVILYKYSYFDDRIESIVNTDHQIEIGSGWSVKKPGLSMYSYGGSDGERYSIFTFQDIQGKACNIELEFYKLDDGTLKYKNGRTSELHKDCEFWFVNNDDISVTSTHRRGFEYNLIIESGNGIRYYIIFNSTKLYSIKAISDRFDNTATIESDTDLIEYTLDSGEVYSVNTSGITREFNNVSEIIVNYDYQRNTADNDPDDFYSCDNIPIFTVGRSSGVTPSDSDSSVKYIMKQILSQSYLFHSIYVNPEINMLVGDYIDTVEYDTGMMQKYIYLIPDGYNNINNIATISKYNEEYSGEIYNRKSYSFKVKKRNGIQYVYKSTKDMYSSADATRSDKEYVYDFNQSGKLISSKTDTTDTYTYSCACFDAPVLIQVHDDGGTLTTNTNYDSKHRMIEQTVGDTATRYTYGKYNIPVTIETDKDSNTVIKTVNTLTEDEKSIAETKVYENDVLKSRTAFTYDSYGNVTSETKYINDTDTIVTNYTHEYLPDCSKKTTVIQTGLKDADGNELSDITAYTITDPYGNTVTSCDGNGNIQTSTFDRINRPLTVTNADGTTKSYEYNSVGNYVISTDELGYKIKVSYDPWGNGEKSEYLDNDTWKTLEESTYDFKHRLSRYKKYISDTDFSYADYTYDRRDNAESEKVYDSSDNQKRYIRYNHIYTSDSDGRPVYEVDTTYYDGNTAKITKINKYNYRDKLTEETYKDGNTVLKTTTNTYDYVGNKIGSTLPGGGAESYTYDINGNILTYTNPMGSIMTYEYDMAGRNISVTDFKGNATTYEYDNAGRKIKISSPFDGIETSLKKTYYDANGNVIKEMTKKNAVGEEESFKTMIYTYDNMNRLELTDNGIIDPFSSVRYMRYEYDAKGNMIHEIKGLRKPDITYETKPWDCKYVDYEYDRFGRVIHMFGYSAYDTTYTYDLTGNKLSETVENGISTGYEDI